jgi:hypothetical protein
MSHSILGHGFYESINTTLSSEAVRASDGISAIYSLAVDFHTHCHTDSHSLLPNRLLGLGLRDTIRVVEEVTEPFLRLLEHLLIWVSLRTMFNACAHHWQSLHLRSLTATRGIT